MKCCEVMYEQNLLADAVRLADSFGTRLRGLMFKESLQSGEGLLLQNCPSVHCCFMRFPIDVVYLDAEYRVLDRETVRPWHIGKQVRHARNVLELAEGKAAGIPAGAMLQVREK